jgi:hypothetical protein
MLIQEGLLKSGSVMLKLVRMSVIHVARPGPGQKSRKARRYEVHHPPGKTTNITTTTQQQLTTPLNLIDTSQPRIFAMFNGEPDKEPTATPFVPMATPVEPVAHLSGSCQVQVQVNSGKSMSKSEVPSAKQKKSPANNTKTRCMFAGGLPSHQHGKEEDFITAGGSSDPPRKSCNLQDHIRTVQANAKPSVEVIITLEGRLLCQKLIALWEQTKFFSNAGDKLPSLKTEEKFLLKGKLVACTRWHVVH